MVHLGRCSFKAAIVCLCLLWLSAGAIGGEKAQRHEFLEGAYSIEAPGDWWAEMDKDFLLTIAPKEDSPTRLMIFAPDPEPGVANSLEYAKLIATGILSAGKEGKILSEEKCELNGRTAYQVTYSMEVDGVKMIGGLYCMISEGFGFVITGMVAEEAFKTFMPEISEVADSFQINQENLAKIRPALEKLAKSKDK